MRNNTTSADIRRDPAPGPGPGADGPPRGGSAGRLAAPAEDGISASGVSFHLWRLYQHAWLVCLLFPRLDLLRAPLAPGRLGLGLSTLVVFATGYTWLMWPHPASRAVSARSQSRGA